MREEKSLTVIDAGPRMTQKRRTASTVGRKSMVYAVVLMCISFFMAVLAVVSVLDEADIRSPLN